MFWSAGASVISAFDRRGASWSVLDGNGKWNGNIAQGRPISLLRPLPGSGAIPADGGFVTVAQAKEIIAARN